VTNVVAVQVFEGLGAAALTPSERNHLLGQQISIPMQGDSAERHGVMQQGSTPNDMITHTNSLAFSQDPPGEMSFSRQTSGRNRATHHTRTPPHNPLHYAHHAGLPQHVVHSTSQKQQQQLQPERDGHGLGPAHIPEPSLFHLASGDLCTDHSRQTSLGVQSLPSTVAGTAQKAGSKLLLGEFICTRADPSLPSCLVVAVQASAVLPAHKIVIVSTPYCNEL
jgi:hypothetical protein